MNLIFPPKQYELFKEMGVLPKGSIKSEYLPEDLEVRPSFITIFCNLAEELSKRSTCERRQVGCVVTSEDYTRVMGIGYNGNYQGGPNKCDRPDEGGNCGCIHAEINSLLKVAESSTVSKILFVTLSPCVNCAKAIINKGGVKKIYITNKHHRQDGVMLLRSQGIEVEHVHYNFANNQFEVR